MRYEVLPGGANALFDERELQQSHTAFDYEVQLFEEIRQGNADAVREKFRSYLNAEVIMGRMSDDDARQFQYWAVSGIAVAVHYAILGGADETDAFNLSDVCIRYVDSETNQERVMRFLEEKLLDLTYMVYYARMRHVTSPEVRRALHFIHLHLHEKITLAELAKECRISQGYLSAQFRKELGMSVMEYVRKKKMETAKNRLREGKSVGQVAYELGFCSETHFIETYKKVVGTTPYRDIRNKG